MLNPLRRPGEWPRMAWAAAMLCIYCMTAGSGVRAAEGESLEYAVKAAYLYKFGTYVEWPPAAFSAPAAAINLCIAGPDPFGPALDTAVREQKINGRPIVIRRMPVVTRDSGCHILYLGMGDMQVAHQNLEATRGSGVLTVSDIPGLGIINFVIHDNRVRFDIDEEAAAQNGLTISSKLLGLALKVKPRQAGARR